MKIKEVDKMTLQEACDYSVSKIVEQGGRCIENGNQCAYDDGRGNHCAIGWLLDHENEWLMGAGGTVADLLRDGYKPYLPTLIGVHNKVFSTLQEFHDERHGDFRASLLNTLKRRGVDTSKPQYQQWVEMGEQR